MRNGHWSSYPLPGRRSLCLSQQGNLTSFFFEARFYGKRDDSLVQYRARILRFLLSAKASWYMKVNSHTLLMWKGYATRKDYNRNLACSIGKKEVVKMRVACAWFQYSAIDAILLQTRFRFDENISFFENRYNTVFWSHFIHPVSDDSNSTRSQRSIQFFLKLAFQSFTRDDKVTIEFVINITSSDRLVCINF